VRLTKAARAELEREAELALAVLEPAASRFDVAWNPERPPGVTGR